MDKRGSRVDVAKRLQEIGVSESYSFELAYAKRDPSDRLAIKIWRETGLKFGSIKDATDEQIEMLASLKGVAA